MNYGHAILESEIRNAINSIGLDYSIGFLHEVNQSRTPPAYDIQELFRRLIDVSVIQLLESAPKLKKYDFILLQTIYQDGRGQSLISSGFFFHFYYA
ncbi:MAG: CRISPR-associated endonuclease Cas1 [Nitrosopumilus sp.]|nr:CRISPR-associated endonuclease Cas1 [Nitrosopumilus sp.]